MAGSRLKTKLPTYFQLKISLDHIHPMIWRRILVPHSISLVKLHGVIQITMGWTNSHLHRFEVGPISFQADYGDWPMEDGEFDENGETLERLVTDRRDWFKYVYDYGDSWEHTVVAERVLKSEEPLIAPICLDGANAAPPEDCGGAYGYRDLRRILRNPNHEEYEAYRRWAGSKFDPKSFDIDAVNKRLERFRRTGRLSAFTLPDIRMT